MIPQTNGNSKRNISIFRHTKEPLDLTQTRELCYSEGSEKRLNQNSFCLFCNARIHEALENQIHLKFAFPKILIKCSSKPRDNVRLFYKKQIVRTPKHQ
jgi:hypothetical protein